MDQMNTERSLIRDETQREMLGPAQWRARILAPRSVAYSAPGHVSPILAPLACAKFCRSIPMTGHLPDIPRIHKARCIQSSGYTNPSDVVRSLANVVTRFVTVDHSSTRRVVVVRN